MFTLHADKNRLTVRQRETLTSGSINVNTMQFVFSEDWEGLTKTAVSSRVSRGRLLLRDIVEQEGFLWDA